MDQTGRLYKIDQLLRQHKVISFAALQAELNVSRATLKRDLDDLRTRLKLPIEWSRAAGGYRLASTGEPPTSTHELPGLWFSSTEIHALMTMKQLLSHLDTGGLIINPVPVADRLNALLTSEDIELQELRQRVRIVGLVQETPTPRYFERIGLALVRRKRLVLVYADANDTPLEWEISPQRLVHFRGSWHLEAWCHPQAELRSFAVDAITDARVLPNSAIEVADDKLDAQFGPEYGVFANGRVRWARLQFNREKASSVANVQWHPLQQGKQQNDGSYLLRVPYMDPRELMEKILQYGALCQVLGPASLRQAVTDEVAQMATIYQSAAPLDEDGVLDDTALD
ncbi:WYL domain-containing protein [Rhodoferax sp.]|uniref:helix-turn-helix transcriptional regulator n=1 Tax=Rhodoferax sp. TaxID=50421 RepID=UPI0025E2EF05|nr:WYL domain-containing protein [Rhodoferax sp.]